MEEKINSDREPLFSICIPTYNRAPYLMITLQNITQQPIFTTTHDVEIVISDNCSTDNTQEVALKFKDMFPDKIIYSRNQTNIYDANFEKALSLGHGAFLKLHNDTLLFKDDALEKCVSIIRSNSAAKPVLFFTNSSGPVIDDIIACEGLDAFIKATSFMITWIGGFGIWKCEIGTMQPLSAYSRTQLLQTKVILELVKQHYYSIVINIPLFTGQIMKKNAYDVLGIMGSNYLSICREYIYPSGISEKTFNQEKRHILWGQIIPYYFNMGDFRYPLKSNNWGIFYNEYKYNWYLYFSPIIIIIYYIYKL